MNRNPLRVLHLEALAEDHERVRRFAGAPGPTLEFERVADRASYEAALRRGGIDLILADHSIPGFPGTDVLELARAIRPSVPYVMVSGAIGEDIAIECLGRGALDFIHKDRLERLPSVILKALQTTAVSERRSDSDAHSDLLQAQKMELVGQLTGGIAHDFSNVLTIVSGYVSMLLDDESLPPAAQESLKRVFTASRQATGLVRQLLLFSQKREPRRELIDLNTEVESMASTIGWLLGKTIVIEFEPSPDSPQVNADLGMIEQVLMNIAVNARDAMKRRGRLNISVDMHASHGEAKEPGGQRPWDHACITLRDSGPGIAADILPKIFEPHFTTKGEGRGTGLSTALEIVKDHNGWIQVDTELGVGTTFRIYLPLAVRDSSAAEQAAPVVGPKATILLVEDEANVREFAAAVLQNEGYKVLQAKAGEQALEIWRWHSSRVSLLLTDVVLPGDVAGPALAEMLLAEKPALRVILTTGYQAGSVKPLRTNGVLSQTLCKPFTPKILLKTVRDGLA